MNFPKNKIDLLSHYRSSFHVDATRHPSFQDFPEELLRITFSMMDRRSCFVASVVCRRWSCVALDELWRSLPSAVPLFKLLGPTDRLEEPLVELHPDVILTEESWDRFRSYAERVRAFTYDPEPIIGFGSISTGLILRTLAAHPEGRIMPHLRDLRWYFDDYGLSNLNILAFCSPSLERMRLRIDAFPLPVTAVKRLLSALTSSVRGLKSFKFSADATLEAAELKRPLINLIRNQTQLQELELLDLIRNPDLVVELCQVIPRLQTFNGELHDFTREEFRATLAVVAQGWPSLRCLGIVHNQEMEEVFDGADIEALLQLSDLEDVKIGLDCHLTLSISDIQHMGQVWRQLKSLILSYWRPGIPFSYLITFANSFPSLERLVATFHCDSEPPSAMDVSCRFASLRILTILDAKDILNTDPLRIAEFLSMICGPGVKIQMSRHGLDCTELFDVDEYEEWSPHDVLGLYLDGSRDILRGIEAFHRVQECIQRMP